MAQRPRNYITQADIPPIGSRDSTQLKELNMTSLCAFYGFFMHRLLQWGKSVRRRSRSDWAVWRGAV